MRIIEGKKAVLRSYLTEKECVKPKQGQTVLPMEPAACPVMEAQTVTCSSAPILDAEIRRPVAYESQEIPDVTIREPIACDIHMLQSAGGTIQSLENITIKQLQSTEAQVVPATPELEQMMGETEAKMSRLKKRKWFADKILHITNLQ